MSKGVLIPSSVLDEIAARGRATPDTEVCGAVLRGKHIPVDNVAPEEQRSRRFRMEPKKQMEIWNDWSRKGDLIIYHSHPKGEAKPSEEDKWVISRSSDVLFLIFSVTTGFFRVFKYSDDACGIVEVEIVATSG